MLDIQPVQLDDPHASCHHEQTSQGDTFGGLGTSKEVWEETSVCLGTPECDCQECQEYDRSSQM